MSEGSPVLVLGAGCSGLAAAQRLSESGRRVIVVEEKDCVGGLAGAVCSGQDVYEYGPHVFHTSDPALLAEVKGLMGQELIPYHRTIQIKFGKAYFRFPLRLGDVLGQLPWATVAAAAGAPIVSIFLRRQPGINPERWKPLGPNTRIVLPPPGQEVRVDRHSRVISGSFDAITPENVLNALNDILP